jgi:hypothetical protein
MICGGDDTNLLLTCKIWLAAVSLQLPSFWALFLIGSCNTQCPNLSRWLGDVKMLFTSFFLYEEWSGRCDLFRFQEFMHPGILIGSCERNGTMSVLDLLFQFTTEYPPQLSMDSYRNNWWAPSNFIQYHAWADISSWQDIHFVRYSKSWICWVHWLIPATYALGYSFINFGSTNAVLENWHFPFLLQTLCSLLLKS